MPGREVLPKCWRLNFKALTAADLAGDAVSLGFVVLITLSLGVVVLLTLSDWESTAPGVWSITLEVFSEFSMIAAMDELGVPVVDDLETGKLVWVRDLKKEKGECIRLWGRLSA